MLSAIGLMVCLLPAQTGMAPSIQNQKPWTLLFDGKSLAGWTVRGGTATYRVEGNTIVGKTTDGSPNTFLATDARFEDFELEFEVKVDNRLNSGVQIRSKVNTAPNGSSWVSGPQVEIMAGPGQAGFIYGEGTSFGWLSPEPSTPTMKNHRHDFFKNEQWNHYRVVAKGPRIQTWVNGNPVADLTHPASYAQFPGGFIGLQVHGIGRGEGPYEVAWRSIRLRRL